MKVSRMRRFVAGVAVSVCLFIPGTSSAESKLSTVGGVLPSVTSVANVICEPEANGMRCTLVLPDGTAKDVYIADP